MTTGLVEFRVNVRRRPIIPFRVKLQHKRQYNLTRMKKRIYNKRYRRRVTTRMRERLRRRIKKRLGKRARRLKIFLR